MIIEIEDHFSWNAKIGEYIEKIAEISSKGRKALPASCGCFSPDFCLICTTMDT
jgi:hypothetical protein